MVPLWDKFEMIPFIAERNTFTVNSFPLALRVLLVFFYRLLTPYRSVVTLHVIHQHRSLEQIWKNTKQEIPDALTGQVLERYAQHSIFARSNWADPAFADSLVDMTPEDAVAVILGQVRYILHDPQNMAAQLCMPISVKFPSENACISRTHGV